MKLFYEKSSAGVESIKILLFIAKIPFQDCKLEMDEIQKLKVEKKIDFKQLPSLIVNDELTVSLENPILHYLGTKFHFITFKEDDISKIKSLMDYIQEKITLFNLGNDPVMQLSENSKKELLDKYYAESLPKLFDVLEKRLEENSSKEFIVGIKHTLADIVLLGFYSQLFRNPTDKAHFVIENYPLLKAYFAKRNNEIRSMFDAITYRIYSLAEDDDEAPIAFLLSHCGAKFTQIKISQKEWETEEKHSGKFEYNKLPCLEENGKIYSQLMAIMQRLAIRYNYLPVKNQYKYARVMSLCGIIKDIKEIIFKIKNLPKNEESAKRLQTKLVNDMCPSCFNIIEKILEENKESKGLFLIGKNYCLADFLILSFIFIEVYNEKSFFSKDFKIIIEEFPFLSEYYKKRLQDFKFFH